MTQAVDVPEALPPHEAPTRAPRWRRWTAGFLIVLSCVLAPLSVLSIWMRNQILNTDRYVATITPLASNPAVIKATAADVTNALFDKIDVESIAKDALPARADFLAAPLESALRQVTEQQATKVLSSDQFRTLWIEANRRAHNRVVRALTNTGTVLSTDNGKIVLDLAPILDQVRISLDQRGITVFDRIPINKLSLKFEVADAKQLESAQAATRTLNRVAWALPILSLVCFGGGVALSSNRRRTVMRWGIGVAIAVAVIGAALALGKSVYLDAVTSSSLPRDTAAAVFDTLVRFLRYGVRLVIAVGLLVAFGAWVSGPSHAAVRVRTTTSSVLTGAGGAAGTHGFGFGGFGLWVAKHRTALRVTAVLLALVVLLLWGQPRASTLLWIVLALVVVLGIIEFVARAALAGHPADGDSAPALGAS